MKLRNNYNVGDRILILHANTKNPLRKDDIGKIGTIIDKRCSFCIVHLDGDDRDKNYNYGTFAKISKVYVKDKPYATLEEAIEAIGHGPLQVNNSVYFDKHWQMVVENGDFKENLLIEVNNKLNVK